MKAKNGFEVFRRLLREADPVTVVTEYSRFAFQQMVFQKCTIQNTNKPIQTMENVISEYWGEHWHRDGRGVEN